MKNVVKILVVNGLILLAGIVIIELIFGGWLNESNQMNNLNVLRDIKRDVPVRQLYPASDSTITYTRDRYGLRGLSTHNQPGEIDILTVGGSTTDQKYIDDEKTWQAVLEREFRKNGSDLTVSNVGVDGQSTYGHIMNFEMWFPLIPDLQPDYILFYIGINDFYRAPGDERYEIFDRMETNPVEMLQHKSAVYNAFRKFAGYIRAEQNRLWHTKLDFSSVNYTDEIVLDKELLRFQKDENIPSFKKRLHQLIEHSEKLGAEPIFITQPTMMYKFKNGKVYGFDDIYSTDGLNWNGVGYYTVLQLLNDAVKEVAGSKYQVIDLTDRNRELFNESDFYDFFHTNESGSVKLGKVLYEELKTKTDS